MNKRNKSGLAYFTICGFFFISIILFSCKDNALFEGNAKIENHAWNIKQVIKFDVLVTDTLSRNDMFINVRHTGDYKFSNLFIFINLTGPDSYQTRRDTFECTLADEKSKWLGKGAGDIVDHRIPFKLNFRLPKPGIYKFEIEQAMREENLPGILDIGMRIEKAQ